MAMTLTKIGTDTSTATISGLQKGSHNVLAKSFVTLALMMPAMAFGATVKAQSAADITAASEKAAAHFEAAVASPSVPGINVAIADQKGVIWQQGFGWADVENKVAMTPLHKMRIGSVAKVIATAAMMRLHDEGKVNLDAPVRTYVPAWPEKHPTITLRQLASHTAGIRHYKAGEFLMNTPYPTVTSGLDIFKNDPLLFQPGEDHSYSTFAWTLVSAAIEGADDSRNFKTIVKDEVFTPLAMVNSSFDEQYELISYRQRPYTWDADQGTLKNAPQSDHSYKWAGGGFIASPADISRFAVAHLGDDYLKPDTTLEMFTNATKNNGEQVPFGIGWVTGFGRYLDRYQDNPEALRIMNEHTNSVMHSGGSNGGITMMILCRDHGRAVTVVKNVDGENSANVFMLALQTLDAFHQD